MSKLSKSEFFIFGQNINTGSFLGGLTKNITKLKNIKILNTPNCENTLVGMGLGLALKGKNALFICKQQDFLLLSLDQIVNTYNSMKLLGFSGSFTIFTIIVNSGYEGPQSRLDNLFEFVSLSDVDSWNISTKAESKFVTNQFDKSGFRICAASQKDFRTEIYRNENKVENYFSSKVFRYSYGKDLAIICFNFSFLKIIKDLEKLERKNISVFNIINFDINFDLLIKKLGSFDKILILDDSKSKITSSLLLENKIRTTLKVKKIKLIKKRDSRKILQPNEDDFIFDLNQILSFFF